MKFIYKTTKGYRRQFLFLLFTILFGTVTGAMFPYVTGKIVDEIFYKQQMKGFLMYFFLYAGLYFVNQCSHGALNYLWAHLKASYVVDIRKQCFRHLLQLKASVWTSMKSGDVMKRIMDDTECFLEFIHRSLFYVLANFLQLAISIGYLLYTNWLLGLVAIVMTPIVAMSIRYFTAKLKVRHKQIQTGKGLVEAWILEMMTGISQWKLLNAGSKVKMDYERKTKEVIEEQMAVGYEELTSSTVNEALTLLGQLCVYVIAAFCIAKDTITVGQFVACAAYFSTCATYFNALGKKLTDISGNLVGIRRVEELMSRETEQDTPGAGDIEIVQGGILFQNVSFGYDRHDASAECSSIHKRRKGLGGVPAGNNDGVDNVDNADGTDTTGNIGNRGNTDNKDNKDNKGNINNTDNTDNTERLNNKNPEKIAVLENFNLDIAPGEKLAFVGKSGEGKSTLMQLLCRLYEPDAGRIYVDGILLSKYTLRSLRSQLAVVQQDNGLFYGSLRKNISLSDDKRDDARLWEILEGLKLKELVEELPEGLDTLVGTGGRALSGGQKQRIAIARCIFRQPKILLLDEATSALDEETERAVNAFIYEQLPDTTILSVAHRFSTVLAADKAVVLEHGHVAAVGNHESLMQESALYKALYEEYQRSAKVVEV